MCKKKTTKQIGDEGEERASKYLQEKGYSLIDRNFRSGRNEIDLICEFQGILTFIEVKFRKNNSYGFGEDSVDEHKMKRLRSAAEDYIESVGWQKDIQFDIIALTPKTLMHFEDV